MHISLGVLNSISKNAMGSSNQVQDGDYEDGGNDKAFSTCMHDLKSILNKIEQDFLLLSPSTKAIYTREVAIFQRTLSLICLSLREIHMPKHGGIAQI